MSSTVDTIRDLAEQDYKWGFVTEIDEDRVPKGLNEDIVRLISARKGEPAFMLEWRLNALRHWFQMEREQGEPKWANLKIAPIDYQDIAYYSAPKQKPSLESLDQVDPEMLQHLRQARHSARRAEASLGRGRRRGLRLGFRGHDLQGQAGRDGRHLLLVL